MFLERGRRLRLENYAHFEESTQSTVRRAYVVAYFRNAAVEAKEAAMLVYIQQQLDYAKLWKLLEFSQVMRCIKAVSK